MFDMLKFSYEKTYLIAFLLACLLLLAVAFLQFYLYVQPCLLTYLERIVMFFLAIVFLSAGSFNHTPLSKKIFDWFALFIALLGIVITGRHIWLQHAPSAHLYPSVHGLLYVPIDTLWSKIYVGTVACAQIKIRLLGISLTEWTMIAFVFFALLIFFQHYRPSE